MRLARRRTAPAPAPLPAPSVRPACRPAPAAGPEAPSFVLRAAETRGELRTFADLTQEYYKWLGVGGGGWGALGLLG